MNENNAETPAAESFNDEAIKAQEQPAADELNNKYLRLYAEFENYRKRVNKDKEELVRYGNESLILELLPILDSLELALKHASGESGAGIVQGVEMTLKELQRTLEKFGLVKIEAAGRIFDPAIHHAMSQVVRDDCEDKMVAEELRPGYRYRDKVVRPSLVAVAMKPKKNASDQTSDEPEVMKNTINENIEED